MYISGITEKDEFESAKCFVNRKVISKRVQTESSEMKIVLSELETGSGNENKENELDLNVSPLRATQKRERGLKTFIKSALIVTEKYQVRMSFIC